MSYKEVIKFNQHIAILDDPSHMNNDGKTYRVIGKIGKLRLLWWKGYQYRCELRIIDITKQKQIVYRPKGKAYYEFKGNK